MTVTEIRPHDKKRSKVFLDGSFAFILYNGELYKFHVKEGEELKKEDYEEIIIKLKKRAKERALHILASMNRTRKQLEDKLKTSGYPLEAVDEAIAYVERFGYINDERYGEYYIESHRKLKSKRRLLYDLEQKGLSKENIEALLENKPIDEEFQIRNFLKKKHFNPQTADIKEKQKLGASLVRKGFPYDMIRSIMENLETEAESEGEEELS